MHSQEKYYQQQPCPLKELARTWVRAVHLLRDGLDDVMRHVCATRTLEPVEKRVAVLDTVRLCTTITQYRNGRQSICDDFRLAPCGSLNVYSRMYKERAFV